MTDAETRQVRNVNGYVAPALTVDAVVLRRTSEWEVLLIRRGRDPFAGHWALPGGFVDVGETLEAACLRELAEETNLQGEIVQLLGAYSDPARDPRGHTVSVTYVCRVDEADGPIAGDDADDTEWFPLTDLPRLAFDHDHILADAREWVRTRDREDGSAR